VRNCDKQGAKKSNFTLVEYRHRIKSIYDARFSNRKMKERGTIAPNFHLKVSLTIIYFLGTWPPVTGKFRLPYLLYTACSFTFILGILLSAEIANVFANWGDMSKLVAVATLLMTNCTHASKVIAINLEPMILIAFYSN